MDSRQVFVLSKLSSSNYRHSTSAEAHQRGIVRLKQLCDLQALHINKMKKYGLRPLPLLKPEKLVSWSQMSST